LARATADGVVDISIVPAWALNELWPEVAVLAQPGQVFDPKDMIRLSDSQRFISIMNELRSDRASGSMRLVAIGWEYGTLVGIGSGLDQLREKRLRVPSPSLQVAAGRMGAIPIVLPFGETLEAMRHKAIDAAIIDSDHVGIGVQEGAVRELQWSPDFTPFASAIVILMNASTSEAFGMSVQRIALECAQVTHEFNVNARENLDAIATEANAAGISVIPVTDQERMMWRDALARGVHGSKSSYDVAAAVQRADGA
jgi:TRAP-type C4-dicarboxylate transport system substrate-binding protein